jgi:hypothetical protein
MWKFADTPLNVGLMQKTPIMIFAPNLDALAVIFPQADPA